MFPILAVLVPLAACGDDPLPPGTCDAETDAVDVTVTTNGDVVFQWEPACALSLLLVEDEASDVWGIGMDEAPAGDPDMGNRIEPPVTYGVAPAGVAEFVQPDPLTDGVEYELVLWRIGPGGEAASVAVRRFTR